MEGPKAPTALLMISPERIYLKKKNTLAYLLVSQATSLRWFITQGTVDMNNELSPEATGTSAQTTLEQMTTSQLHQHLHQN
jgi:hypothetical protein